jgi:peptidyl-prolyl cis-trans isomerase A (cyclophilin A)
VASIIQRILGLGFLMGSVILGMTLAQSQNAGRDLVQASTTLTSEQAEAARAFFAEQQKASANPGAAPASGGAPHPYNGAPIRPPGLGGSTPPPAASFVPSEVEIFQNSLAKHVEPRAIIHTTLGDIELKLYSALAPNTVKNFLDLARGEREFSDARTSKKTRRPFYNGLTIHKVVSGEYVQMGCPMGNGRGGPGYTIADEIAPQLKFDRPYVVAMAAAREGIKPKKDSNGSQFFITLNPNPKWDGVYTIFGTVVKGQKILDTISSVDVGPTDRPIRKVFITAIDVIDEDNPHSPAPAMPMDPTAAPVSHPGPASVAPPVPAPAPGAPAAVAPAAPAAPAAAPAAPGAPAAAGGAGLAVPPTSSGGLAVPPQ